MTACQSTFTWSRRGGYEVSSKGDKRFSAFNALLADGRSIECHYQCDVKDYDRGGTNWRLGKGKPPLVAQTPDELWCAYLALWRSWAFAHPGLMQELRKCVLGKRGVLSDCFASTSINQANALSVLLNDGLGIPSDH